MVQVKGRLRLLTQRFSKDFAGRVKYSTLWPSRRDSPSEARRAMPTSGDFCGRGNRERESMRIRLLFANNKCFRRHCQARDAAEDAHRAAAGTAALRLRSRLLSRLLKQLGVHCRIEFQRRELRGTRI